MNKNTGPVPPKSIAFDATKYSHNQMEETINKA